MTLDTQQRSHLGEIVSKTPSTAWKDTGQRVHVFYKGVWLGNAMSLVVCCIYIYMYRQIENKERKKNPLFFHTKNSNAVHLRHLLGNIATRQKEPVTIKHTAFIIIIIIGHSLMSSLSSK